MNQGLGRFHLQYNPFEPAASGAPTGMEPWIPEGWRLSMESLLATLGDARGPKALAILGEYGSGKTYLLRWLEFVEFPSARRRTKPYYLDNPGVQFYYLANTLLRQVGRYEFAKMLWEYLLPELHAFQTTFLEQGLMSWLISVKKFKRESAAITAVADAIRRKKITSDEEIANRLGKIVVGTLDQPYFEYQDFVAGRKDAVVAENEEAPYFAAIIRTLKQAGGLNAIAFLLDEFEEISLQKRLSQRQAYDYLATIKRLINVAQDEDFWLVVTMTPEAARRVQGLEPALWDRFTSHGEYAFSIPPLGVADAIELIRRRLRVARQPGFGPSESCFPFPEDFATVLRPTTVSSPRRLVKVAFYCLAEAQLQADVSLPFTADYLKSVEDKVYPAGKGKGLQEANRDQAA
jgi:hypothetical protein